MEPGEAINVLESVLRQLVQIVVGDEWRQVLGTERVSELEARRGEEAKRREGAVVDQNLLNYTHTWDLRRVIRVRWVEFKLALGDKKVFEVYMDRVEDFRNVPMHSRSLLPFEVELLSGIVGQIRNQVTMYRSELGPDSKHYPVIDLITDSFGQQLYPQTPGVLPPVLRLAVGDSVTFKCRGTDPQGRPLHWEVSYGVVGRSLVIDSADGDDVALTWSVAEDHVAERVSIVFTMASNGRFHRNGPHDALHGVNYEVEPPEEDAARSSVVTPTPDPERGAGVRTTTAPGAEPGPGTP